MGNALQWPHLLLILAVILLLFGAAKLPALAKSMGQSARVFRGEMKAMKEEDKDAQVVETTVTDPVDGVAKTEQSTSSDSPPRSS